MDIINSHTKDDDKEEQYIDSNEQLINNSNIPSYIFKTSYGANLLRLLSINKLNQFQNSIEQEDEKLIKKLNSAGVLGSSPFLFYDDKEYHLRLKDILIERKKNASILPMNVTHNSRGNHHNRRRGSNTRDNDDDEDEDEGEDEEDDTGDNNVEEEGDDDDFGGDGGFSGDQDFDDDGDKIGNNLISFFPTGWRQNKGFKVDISSDGLELSTNNLKKSKLINNSNTRSNSMKYYSLRSNHSISREIGIFYYETTILFGLQESDISIGFMDCDRLSDQIVSNLRGSDSNSWGYNGKDGKLSCLELSPNFKYVGIKFGIKDTIGCGVNFITSKIFYTKNGVYIGEAFDLPSNIKNLSAVISLSEYNTVITNFGTNKHKKFLFGIDSYVNSYKSKILKNINQIKLPKFTINDENSLLLKYLPNDNNNKRNRKSQSDGVKLSNKDFPDIVNSFVRSYMDHMGYIDAGNALDKDLQLERDAYNCESSSTFDGSTITKTKGANGSNTESTTTTAMLSDKDIEQGKFRKLIRDYITNNEFDEVIELLKTKIPDLISTNTRLIFKLQCLKLLNYIDLKETKKAMSYGNFLKDEYITSNADYVKYLTDISSLLIYEEPRKSIYGFLLDPIEKNKLIDEILKLISNSNNNSSSDTSVFDKILSSTEFNLNAARENNKYSNCLLLDLTEDFLQI